MNAATIPAAMSGAAQRHRQPPERRGQSLPNRLKDGQNLRGEQDADRGFEERVDAADAPCGERQAVAIDRQVRHRHTQPPQRDRADGDSRQQQVEDDDADRQLEQRLPVRDVVTLGPDRLRQEAPDADPVGVRERGQEGGDPEARSARRVVQACVHTAPANQHAHAGKADNPRAVQVDPQRGSRTESRSSER